MQMLKLPDRLTVLVDSGAWPSSAAEEGVQNNRPLASRVDVQRFAPDERTIYFLCPPFFTVAQRISQGSTFWRSAVSATHQLRPELALDIGSFGLGSDSVIALDYQDEPAEPKVVRLVWNDADPNRNEWRTIARTFSEFCEMIPLFAR